MLIPLNPTMKIIAVITAILPIAYATSTATVTYPPQITGRFFEYKCTDVAARTNRYWNYASITPGAQAAANLLVQGSFITYGGTSYPHHFGNFERIPIETQCAHLTRNLQIFPLESPAPLIYTGGRAPMAYRVILATSTRNLVVFCGSCVHHQAVNGRGFTTCPVSGRAAATMTPQTQTADGEL